MALRLIGFCLAVFSLWISARAFDPPATVLRIGDVINITVIGADEYSGDFPVLRDGTISGKGFGQIIAAGKTLSGLERDVVRALSKILRKPTVRASLKSLRAENVFLIGIGPSSSGPVPFVPGLTIRQVISSADAPPGDSIEFHIILNRGTTVTDVDYDEMIAGRIPDIPLQPDDVVTIARKPYHRIWVMGFVAKPGIARISIGSDLYQAIAAAGGLLRPTGPESTSISEHELTIQVRRGPEILEFPAQPAPNAPRFKLLEGDLVTVVAPAAVRISVLGMVNKPGDYLITKNKGLLGAIAAAEGVAPEGTLEQVVVIRHDATFIIDAHLLTSAPGGPGSIQDGDVVYVRRNEKAVLVLGFVNKPGRKPILDGQILRVSDALALAEGVSEQGSLRRVFLARAGESGKIAITEFNLDEFLKSGKLSANPVIQPGDVLLFGQPKGVNLQNLSQFLSSAILIESLFKR